MANLQYATQADYVAAMEARRAAWNRKRAALLDQITGQLIDLFKGDYDYQHGVRGISNDPALGEVSENIDLFTEGLATLTKRGVFELVEDERLNGPKGGR